MKFKQYFLLTAAIFATACSDDDGYKAPSTVPSVPTQMSLEDGAQISELSVTLNAAGSTVEDEELKVSYVYYIGTSATEMEPTDATVTLEPYTQYFWCAQAKTEVSDGEMTPTRTFYCVPGFNVTTDNGDGINAAIIRWDKADRFKNVTVSATSDHEGYGLESQTVENGVDTCTFLYKRDVLTDTNNAYVHWWDDEHGVYYEPVIYTFNVEATVEVGDTTFILNKSAKEIILDKQWTVRDHEFNVYRVVHIGDQTWLADDLRAISYIDKQGNVVQLEKDEHYSVSTLKSGAVGYLYGYSAFQFFNAVPFIKGYSIPTDDDFMKLEAYYGLQENTKSLSDRTTGSTINGIVTQSKEGQFNYRYFEGDENELLSRLACKYDWENVTINTQNLFMARPFGIGSELDWSYFLLPDTQGWSVAYATQTEVGSKIFVRILTSEHKGIARVGVPSRYNTFSIRAIKK